MTSNVNGAFNPVNPPVGGADTYLEISFTGTESIAPGQFCEIQSRINKTDWSNYNENDDYSYDPNKTDFADWDHITVYQNSNLVWGVEP